MQLHKLSSIQEKKPHRIGRSGKRGSYSGRGVKGQKSRSGRRLRPAERDLIMRLPKMRGFANKPKSDKAIAFNLSDLNTKLKSYHEGKGVLEVNLELLKAAGLVRAAYWGGIKLLGTGEIAFPIKIKDLANIKVSESAKMKIEKAGGSINN